VPPQTEVSSSLWSARVLAPCRESKQFKPS